jgi:DNA invertase Pin-like site-specific DNA recombinase
MMQKQVLTAIEMQKSGVVPNQQIAEKFEVGRSTLLRYVADYKKKMKEEE